MITITVQADGTEANASRTGSDQEIAQLDLTSSQTTIELYNSLTSHSVLINRLGHSVDYELSVQHSTMREARWFIHGLSGQMQPVDDGGGNQW